jgi:serine/threonine protein kinase
VPQSDVGPGSVVADRFRLEDLLEDTSGARFWRARDLTLARDVAVHVVAADDPRAPALLTAARTSALVTDSHILRVLDAVEQDDLVFVVHEYGSGMSLDRILAEEGVLDPRRAVWLVREVAEAVVAGHGTGVAHGRLVPENVMITEAGSVKLIGLVVSGVLHGRPETAPDGSPPPSEHESDVTNLGALLYACLVGRWPGYPDSVVAAAPRDHGRLLRPRQVKAGVPKALDTLCGQILAGPPRGRSAGRTEDPRFESAAEVVEALSRWLGDGAGSVVTPGTAYAGPAAYVDPARAPGPDGPVSLGSFDGDDETGDQSGTGAALAAGAADPEATQASPLARPPARPARATEDRDAEPTVATPLSLPVSSAESDARPSSSTSSTSSRVAPASGPLRWGPDALRGPGAPPPSPRGDRPGSVWLRLAGLLAVLALIVIGVLVILDLGSSRDADDTPSSDDPGSSQGATAKPVRVTAVRDLDPPSQGGNGEEHPEEAALAADGDPGTAWTTQTYDDGPRLAPYKQGLGLVLDLGSEQSVRALTVTLGGSDYAFDVYAAPEGARGPTDITGLERIGREEGVGGRTQVTLDAVTTRYVVLWLTALAPAPGGDFRGSVQEVVVRS